MVGRYMKYIADFDSYNCKYGDILKILEDDGDVWLRLEKFNWLEKNSTFMDRFELMPEGFIPESEQSNLLSNLIIW